MLGFEVGWCWGWRWVGIGAGVRGGLGFMPGLELVLGLEVGWCWG